VIVFADRIALAGWIGMATIIASGALATWLAQRRPRAGLDEPLSADIR